MIFGRRNKPGLAERVRVFIWPRRSWLRSGKYFVKRILRLTGSPYAIAAGVAAGAFTSFTPFLGFHFIISWVLAFIIGGVLGLAAAIARGWLDQLLSRTVDVLMAIPSLIFALVLLSIFGSTVTNLIIIIAVLDSTRVFRLTRAVSINVVVMDYVEAARLRGEGLIWVMRREILPNIMPPLIAEFGLRFCFVFLTIAALSFLGVGIQPPTADWGSMVRENASLIQFAQYDLKAGLTPLLPAAAIAILTVAVNFVVDWFLHKTSGIRDEQ